MRIAYCMHYRSKNDGKIYIPIVHSDDRKYVMCLRLYYDIKDKKGYHHIEDNMFVKVKRLKSIKVNELEGPLMDVEGEEIGIPMSKRNAIYHRIWEHKIEHLKNIYNTSYRGESIKFLTWTIYKYMLDSEKKVSKKILDKDNRVVVKKKCIYWVNFGHNIGVEQRKERPAIIWRKFDAQDKYYVIPITTKEKKIKHHIKLEGDNMFATLEHMKLVSVKRVNRPYFDEKKSIKRITDKDVSSIKLGLCKFLGLEK